MATKQQLAEIEGLYLVAPAPVFRLEELYPQFLEHFANADTNLVMKFLNEGRVIYKVRRMRFSQALFISRIKKYPPGSVAIYVDGVERLPGDELDYFTVSFAKLTRERLPLWELAVLAEELPLRPRPPG